MYDNCTDYTAVISARYPGTRVDSVNNLTVLIRGGPDTVQLPVTTVGSEQQGVVAHLLARSCVCSYGCPSPGPGLCLQLCLGACGQAVERRSQQSLCGLCS